MLILLFVVIIGLVFYLHHRGEISMGLFILLMAGIAIAMIIVFTSQVKQATEKYTQTTQDSSAMFQLN